MDYINAKQRIGALTKDSNSKISVLQEVNAFVNNRETEQKGRDLVIRSLDKIDMFNDTEKVFLLGLVRTVGLFPYISDHLNEIPLEDRLAYELHRADWVDRDIVFHTLQVRVFNLLMQGRNVVLSASTSVGKSLVIDAVLGKEKFKKVVIVLPTIALIDETRRRITRRFSGHYSIITHPSQNARDDIANVYLLTQERVLQRTDLNDVDFFVVDEFYKIDLSSDLQDGSRAIDLSLAFHKLSKNGAQFYLLGPHIQNVYGLYNYEYNFVSSDFATVAVDVECFNLPRQDESRPNKLLELCGLLKSPTLIYCQSPSSSNTVANTLIQQGNFSINPNTAAIAEWIGQNYHPEWNVAKAIALGIGIHHGGVPRSLQQYFVKLFNEGTIKFLICTSTMIEGVNTSAENVIIYDRRNGRSCFDFFTFKNISGRAGRMKQYFIGKVFMLEAPPTPENLAVDYPIGLQNDKSPLSLLFDLESEYLTDSSKSRLTHIYDDSCLSPATLRANRHVSVDSQLQLAKVILDMETDSLNLLTWKGNPDKHQLEFICTLIYGHLEDSVLNGYAIHSGCQLAWHINKLRIEKNLPDYLQDAVYNILNNETSSEVINNRLKFIRNIICYRLPRDLMAVSRIQEDILGKMQIEAGDYSFFSEQLENMFIEPLLVALDEYGIPTQISKKFQGAILPANDFNEVINNIKHLSFTQGRFQLNTFELDMMTWAITDL